MFEVKINNTDDSAAFYTSDGKHNPEYEIAAILGEIITDMANSIVGGDLHDSNGNLVGEWSIDA